MGCCLLWLGAWCAAAALHGVICVTDLKGAWRAWVNAQTAQTGRANTWGVKDSREMAEITVVSWIRRIQLLYELPGISYPAAYVGNLLHSWMQPTVYKKLKDHPDTNIIIIQHFPPTVHADTWACIIHLYNY